MYSYTYDEETGGIILNNMPLHFSNEPRPVYYKELDILGFDKYWTYEKNDAYPYMWAEANNYYYRGRRVAKLNGGALYTAPEIEIIDAPELNNAPLRFIDIPAMVEKNRDILEGLVQDSIKKVYNTYIEYRKKVDLFYVAFSGGKDSIVTLDIVQRALPHNEFCVLFGDTGMEFIDTYKVIDETEKWCKTQGIKFYRAKSQLTPEYTWNKIGPPAQKMRWCCSVHKTAPQILLLRKITQNPHFCGMAMMGVRADESVTRSKYEELNFGTKHKGQYDFYPIFNWNSAELFLYIYANNLTMNSTYLCGNSRAGCLVCPMEANKNSWFKEQLYGECDDYCRSTKFFYDIIYNTTIAKRLPKQNVREFMEIGVWKSRHDGRKLFDVDTRYTDEIKNGSFTASIIKASSDWMEWIKTIGRVTILPNGICKIEYNGLLYCLHYEKTNTDGYNFSLNGLTNTRDEILLIADLKNVFRKSAYCIQCQVCEANCPHGFISMQDGRVVISDSCVHCKMCHKVDYGCLVANSVKIPKEVGAMNKSVDRYKNMGIRFTWVKEYFKKQDAFWNNNGLGSMMVTSLRTFLSDAGISLKNQITPFGSIVVNMGVESEVAWGLMLCNLAYTPQFNWWVKNITFNELYSEERIKLLLSAEISSENSKKNIISGFKNIFYTNPILGTQIGMGICNCEVKGNNVFLIDVQRTPWQNPDPLVILYALYKFAEACGGYYQFTLTRLMNHDIESDGISPTEIFGLSREQMEKVLNGLSINHPEFISASFTLDLDNINLKSDKTSADVLKLF